MSRNTVKPGLPRAKRAKRVVENAEYASFARRILRAYARRVAGGDVEALRHLVLLPCDVDALTRTAVEGLRKHGYSWGEIADRLGVSRQAVQMRYGGSTRRGALDRRLVEAGMAVPVSTLVTVFADHYAGYPAASLCPGCGYRYPDGVSDCPTNATVRPVLYRRRAEDRASVARLNPDQFADLHNHGKPPRAARVAATRQAARPAPGPDRDAPNLFDVIHGKDSPS